MDRSLLWDESMGGGVPIGEVATLDAKDDLLRLAFLDVDALECFQLLDGMLDGGGRVGDVELYDLIAIMRASVGDRYTDLNLLLVLADELGLSVGELRIAQTMAKGVEYVALMIHIGSTMTDVVVHDVRQVEDVFDPCLRGASSWIDIAKESVGYGMPLLLATMCDV